MVALVMVNVNKDDAFALRHLVGMIVQFPNVNGIVVVMVNAKKVFVGVPQDGVVMIVLCVLVKMSVEVLVGVTMAAAYVTQVLNMRNNARFKQNIDIFPWDVPVIAQIHALWNVNMNFKQDLWIVLIIAMLIAQPNVWLYVHKVYIKCYSAVVRVGIHFSRISPRALASTPKALCALTLDVASTGRPFNVDS